LDQLIAINKSENYYRSNRMSYNENSTIITTQMLSDVFLLVIFGFLLCLLILIIEALKFHSIISSICLIIRKLKSFFGFFSILIRGFVSKILLIRNTNIKMNTMTDH